MEQLQLPLDESQEGIINDGRMTREDYERFPLDWLREAYKKEFGAIPDSVSKKEIIEALVTGDDTKVVTKTLVRDAEDETDSLYGRGAK